MFQSVSKLWLLVIVVFAAGASATDDAGTYCDGTGWFPFRDEKCYKLIQKWANRNEAKDICAEELLKTDSSSPQLVAIKSVDEQNFLTDYIFNKSEVEINVWTGAKRVPNLNQFVWEDGSSLEEYTNWAEGSPTENDKSACVVMQSEVMQNIHEIRRVNGKWRDVSCESPNYVVCEKLPRWSIGKLQQTLLEQRKKQLETEIELTATKTDLTATKSDLAATKTELSTTKSELNGNIANLKQNIIPIGFLYTQLPNQQAPADIWPWMNWLDVSSIYAGVFFRVYGAGSGPFGQEQQENAPYITRIQNNYNSPCENYGTVLTVIGGWSQWILSGQYGNSNICFRYEMSGGDIRPRNMAIRVWKRIG